MKNKNIQDQINLLCWEGFMVKFMFSKKATKIDEIFTIWNLLHNVNSTVKILSIFVAFSETVNFNLM